ncbi:MAG TPA: hypothetical protein PKD20_03135 [Candidatus Saccharibacteria bacterium]|jgi:hypothetical protein|nr:hypothetical protein [Candidatus Saccharibacteria bacterium]HMT55845.1 hypothetical protein [Candidatus Saccharibacteria bacterium]
MGKGSSTNQTGVVRHKPSYSSDPVAVGGGSGPAPEMAAGCLFAFTEEVVLDGASAMSAHAGQAITLMPSAIRGELIITAGNGAHLGVYEGEYVTQILRCMRKKYVYQGTIDSVVVTSADTRIVIISVQGLGQL